MRIRGLIKKKVFDARRDVHEIHRKHHADRHLTVANGRDLCAGNPRGELANRASFRSRVEDRNGDAR
jgi:hypothetical protein